MANPIEQVEGYSRGYNVMNWIASIHVVENADGKAR